MVGLLTGDVIMKKIKLGILGTSEIAFRRFMPSLMKNSDFEYCGIASRDILKTKSFVNAYGGKAFLGYDALINSFEIDAVYIPLPPALHFKWAMKALQAGKHVFLEKPSVTKLVDAEALVSVASNKGLALHENYMFQYHSQLSFIQNLIEQNAIGNLRLIRIAFGFPKRESTDFRYNKELGGGALLDCGGYTIRLANILLGDSTIVVSSQLNYEEYDVDLYGSAVLKNSDGLVAQVSFGMDNSYKCELELWGSNGYISAPRIFTAPTVFEPSITISIGNEQQTKTLPQDDQFLGSISRFSNTINDINVRQIEYKSILNQMRLINDVIKL